VLANDAGKLAAWLSAKHLEKAPEKEEMHPGSASANALGNLI
jgi:hypothetical protein